MERGLGLQRVLLIFLLVAGGTLTGVFLLRSRQAPIVEESVRMPLVYIEGVEAPVRVLIAADNERRIQGLSGHPGLASDEGMLFFFDYSGKPGFWMKDMLFPIDIIWISDEWKIVDITKNISSDTYPQTFAPKSDARYVLEVRAGFADAHMLKIGQAVSFKK